MQVSTSSRSARVIVRSIATLCAATMICAPIALLASCGGKPGPRMAVMRVTHRFVSSDKHESTISVGEELGTELEFGAGTGYGWTAKGFDTGVLKLKSQQSKSEAPDDVVGGTMVEHFVFEGVKPGETTITFELRRPWEKDAAPAKTHTMEVKVVKESTIAN